MIRNFVLAGSIFLTLSGCALLPMGTPHNSIIDGHSIMYVGEPDSSPTVVFEAGLGDGFSVWSDVYNSVQEFASVFAYSRPGYSAGLSQFSIKNVRTADQSAALLRKILAESSSPAPYILVGHSIGGLYVLEFARDYPELVAGLVLVDARLPGFTEKCEMAGIGICLPPAATVMMSPPHVAAEIRGIRPSERVAPMPVDIGSVPTVLIAATKPPPGGSADTQSIWLEVQKEYSDSLQNGTLLIAEGSGHYIQRDAPLIVIDSIRKLVNQKKTASP